MGIDTLVDQIDTDRNGELDLGEVLAFMLSHNALPSRNAFRQVNFPLVDEVHVMQEDQRKGGEIKKELNTTCIKKVKAGQFTGRGLTKKAGLSPGIVEKRAAAAAAKQQALKSAEERAAETLAQAAEG